jgi:hypothetical protein
LTERDKRPTKRRTVTSADSRSSARRRGEAEQKGAPAARGKKTRELIEDSGFAERPHIARSFTGSDDQNFSRNLVHQAVFAQCPDYSASDEQVGATLAAMAAMQPADALEGMFGAQLTAIHHAAMECYRRAAIDGQNFHGWRESLNQASKLSRTFVALSEALDRRRGKGKQQRIIVERVNVSAGGQAIVGSVTSGARGHQELQEQSNATRAIAHEPSIPLRSQDTAWETVPVASGSRKAPV